MHVEIKLIIIKSKFDVINYIINKTTQIFINYEFNITEAEHLCFTRFS